jgi:hypothetical protein
MTATVTIASHTRVYSDKTVSVAGGTLTTYDIGGAIADGDTVYVYYDDPTRAGGAVTYEATKVQATSVNSATNIGRHFVGQVTVPVTGSGATAPGAVANPPGVQGAQTGVNLVSGTYGNLTDTQLVTALGTAAAIAGQGSLATQSNVNLGTQVTGTLGTSNAAAGLINSNVTPSTLTYTGGATVQSLQPAQAGADVTGSHTAASITGQGSLATANNVTYGTSTVSGFGSLAGQSTANTGQIVSISGGTAQSDASLITAQGTASAIAGQGALATQSSIAYGSSFATGFGTYAGKSGLSMDDVSIVDGSSFYRYPAAHLTKVNTVQTGADVTSAHTAAAIISQGQLATSPLTPAQVANSNITIASNGTLSGGGGGAVTIGGLGYTGDLNATHGAIWISYIVGTPANLTGLSG